MNIYIYILKIARRLLHNFVHQQYVKWQNWGQYFFVSFMLCSEKLRWKKTTPSDISGFLLPSKVLLSTVYWCKRVSSYIHPQTTIHGFFFWTTKYKVLQYVHNSLKLHVQPQTTNHIFFLGDDLSLASVIHGKTFRGKKVPRPLRRSFLALTTSSTSCNLEEISWHSFCAQNVFIVVFFLWIDGFLEIHQQLLHAQFYFVKGVIWYEYLSSYM